MEAILFISLIFIFLGLLVLVLLLIQKKRIGVLSGKRIYQDTETTPGKVLYAKTLPLCGKPDFLIQNKESIIPVEVKMGRTPVEPYLSHTMQLLAYCFLVEENYGVRPVGGYIRYPEKEFKVAYTDEARESLKALVKEVQQKKASGEEIHCHHKEHYL